MFWMLAAPVVAMVLMLRFCIISVRQNTAVVVENMFTGVRRVLKPGLHLCGPVWLIHYRKWKYDKDYYAHPRGGSSGFSAPTKSAKGYIKTNVREYDPEVLKARTKDQVNVEIDLLCFYKVVDMLKSVGEVDNLKSAIAGGINTEVYRRVAMHDHQDLNHADLIGDLQLKAINQTLAIYGVTVTSVRVEGICMPDKIAQSIQDAVGQRQVSVTKLKAVETQNYAKITMAKAEMDLMELKHVREQAAAKHDAAIKLTEMDVELQKEKALRDVFATDASFVQYKQIMAWSKLAENGSTKTVFAPLDALQMATWVTRNTDEN